MRSDIRVATNQAPPLVGHNIVTADVALVEAVTRHASAEVVEDLVGIGAEAGTAEAREHGMLANEHHPRLIAYDRYGNRVDEVEFHPSWHWLMERAVGHGLAAAPWESDAAHAHVRRAAGFMAWSHTEPGHGCPISMTYAAVPALRADDALAKEWTPLLASTSYDPGLRVASGQARRAGRHGDDREAGRLRRPRQRHRGAADLGGRRVHAARAQVVHLRADERRLPGARAGRGRGDLLRGAAGAPRRHPQPARRRAAQGQARQPVERLVGAGVRRHRRAPARRRGPRRAHHHRDGRRHPARLRARLDLADAARGQRGDLARRPTAPRSARCWSTSR